MDLREPELILDQMKTYGDLYSKELPEIIKNPCLNDAELNLKEINSVYAIGNGDSLFAAQAAAYGFKGISGINYFALPAMEFLHYIIPSLGKRAFANIMLIGISASGNSHMVIRAIEEIQRLYPEIKTVGVCGKDGSPLAIKAAYNESVQLLELGRAPGIRTYAASLAGLFSLACSIAEAKGRKLELSRQSIAAFLEEARSGVEKTIDYVDSIGAELARLADSPFISCIGSGPDQATAAFSGAKIVEASGVYSVGQDLEEWNHVESFAYPLDSTMIIFANPGPAYKRATSLIKAGKALGHKAIVVCPEGIHDFDNIADQVLPVFGTHHGLLAPFVQYIPGTVLSYYMAKKHKRAMFMSDRNR